MSNLRQKWILLGLMSILFVSLNLCIPVCAIDADCRGTSLPVVDAVDDVWNVTSPSSPWEGIQGDYQDEVDMKAVSLVGDHLSIEFCAFAVRDAEHQLRFYVDEDDDYLTAEYYLLPSGASDFVLKNDSHHWDGSKWVPVITTCTYSLDGYNLTIYNVSRAIPTLNTSLITIVSSYYFNNHWIMDFIPCEPPAGIPGFQDLYLIFGLLTLMGIAVVQCRRS